MWFQDVRLLVHTSLSALDSNSTCTAKTLRTHMPNMFCWLKLHVHTSISTDSNSTVMLMCSDGCIQG
eukprot:jgi/Chrzof1/15265/UNPLg00662.t1